MDVKSFLTSSEKSFPSSRNMKGNSPMSRKLNKDKGLQKRKKQFDKHQFRLLYEEAYKKLLKIK